MLKIRLTRVGKKHQPQYRIVVTEHTNPVQGKFHAIIGNYNPATKQLTLDKELAMKWMNSGAKPSNTVAKLFKQEKINHKSVVVQVFPDRSKEKNSNKETKPEKTEETPVETETPATEAPEETSEETTETAPTEVTNA